MSAEGISFLRMAAVEDGISWINIHHTGFLPDGRTIIPGNAHLKIRTALEDANYWASRGHCVYLAQGMFRNSGPDRKPYPSAIRQHPNLVACKNLYMDVDVKGGGYASTNDALRALKAFHAETKLPEPTIIVGSGNGGLHVYWTLSTAFEPVEFRRMAAQLVAAGTQHGLLFDKQCTSDAIRLLRIPGTWNFKGGPNVDAKPVTLMCCDKEHIDIDHMREALAAFKAVPTHRVGTAYSQSKPSVNDDLAGGMGKSFPPANIDEAAKDCPFIAHTLETGGAELVGEPQWHLATALACHCDDSSATVHRLCEKNHFYDHDKTEEKLGIALRQRELRPEIGPPLCATIHNTHNIPQCANCPHLALNTTPLALVYKRPNNQAHAAFTASPNVAIDDQPESYYRGVDDLIYTTALDDDGNETPQLVFPYQIIPGSAVLEVGDPSYKFSFDTILGERQVNKKFDTTFASDNLAFTRAMFAAGMAIPGKPDSLRLYMANYLKLLQEKKETLITAPAFGWAQDIDGGMGFAYGGQFVSSKGTRRACTPDKGALDYRVQGDDAVWTGLMNIILTDDRPDIACMVASSFGAPLVRLTGEHGLLLGLWSTESGIGKSTALTAAQAVWGKPVVGGMSDTINYTFSKCATLKHLPIYYDEIKGEKQLKSMVELVFQLTGGREKGRAGRGGEMREVREFETLCAYASNSSIVEAVRDHDQGTDASWYRMFEMRAIIKPNDAVNFANEVRTRLIDLSMNFGGIGKKYAEYLGANYIKLSHGLVKWQVMVAADTGADPQIERFWIAAVSTTMLGAWIANHLKLCTFPLGEMYAYMVDEYKRMKEEMRVNPSDLSSDTAMTNMLGAFLNEKQPRNMLILDKTWTSPYRPRKDYAKVLNEKVETGWGTIEVQVSGDPLVLRIADTALKQWCEKYKFSKTKLTEQLEKKLGARRSVTSLGSGSHRATAKQNLWVIDAKGTILEDMLEYTINHKFLPP